ncbi:DedA family protein [Rufibacter sediminis]|uniref:VTT domain-containing protein n=1 Tax=Rufibacter sediminis TaxID=2762756 RepID=A0ABR6VMG0_9BACT|nr:VTT domain-containing protein [Rufibacter sediminis]MBC3538394.1 VTT domain-containing protein [Rufibacter sediminis]
MTDLFLVAWSELFSSPENMIRYGGLTLILVVVFVETGLLIGLVIPGGDSLLLATGLLAGADVLTVPLGVLLASMTAAGVAGDLLGFTIGRRMGKRLYHKQDTWYFKRKHLERAEKFYREKGKSAIVVGKFVPVVRTFNPLLAGVTGMALGRFVLLSFMGTALWICSLVLASYYLGQQFPQLKDYLHYAIPVIILLSILPGFIQYLKERRKSANA